jgi:hypothetical protein
MARSMTTRTVRTARLANPILNTLAAGILLGLAVWLLLPLFPSLTSVIGEVAAALRAVLHRDVAPPVTFTCTASETQPPGLPGSLLFMALGIVFFIGGNALGRLRMYSHEAGTTSNRLFKGFTVLLFFGAAIALGYETVGTWMSGLDADTEIKPITSFVRCAAYHYPVYAAILASTVSFLVGHWLHRTAS